MRLHHQADALDAVALQYAHHRQHAVVAFVDAQPEHDRRPVRAPPVGQVDRPIDEEVGRGSSLGYERFDDVRLELVVRGVVVRLADVDEPGVVCGRGDVIDRGRFARACVHDLVQLHLDGARPAQGQEIRVRLQSGEHERERQRHASF